MVEVTLDNVVTEVMTGAKALKQLNVDIPDPALQILKQVNIQCDRMTHSLYNYVVLHAVMKFH